MKIIIADDFYSNRLLIMEILKDMGHELIEAENGQQAFDALEKHDDVDLVLMDIEMPVMSGLEAMRADPDQTILSEKQRTHYCPHSP